MKQLTKEQQAQFPKTMTVRYYPQHQDVTNVDRPDYVTDTVINNEEETAAFYEGLDHEANLTIEVKLPSGVIV